MRIQQSSLGEAPKRRLLLLAAAAALCLAACPKPREVTLQDLAEPITAPGWITFKESARVDPRTLFAEHAALFRLAAGNEMALESEDRDPLGITHFRYRQLFQGIPVENAEFLVHAREGRALSANGELATDFQPRTTQPAIPEAQALRIVRDHLGAERFFREDDLAADLARLPRPGEAPYLPKGALVFAELPGTGSETSAETGAGTAERRLAWMFRAYTFPLDRSRRVYVDAADGKVLKELPLLPECFAGSGETTFRGRQNFNTGRANIPSFGERFVLNDDCHGNQLHMISWNTGGDTREIFDGDNLWLADQASLVTSYWALGIAYDYFDLVHGRKSYDGKNANLTILNDPTIGDGAFGGNGSITIGPGATSQRNDDYNTTDIVGHEFTHNVIEKSARLAYDKAKESAALNESFSDIFGTLIERWDERNVNPEWIIGDDKGCAGGRICRDLKNPKAWNQPDTYKGRFWMSANVDPHVNGSVQNRWFALLTDGGTGKDEANRPYDVTGIGLDRARRIAYRTLTRYLTAGSDYADAREGSLQAARDLYGAGSQVEGNTLKAWCAVGLCPYTVPRQPDVFDRPGGNPNPASPDNNNTRAGATPLGTPTHPWPVGTRPRLKVPDLSLYPFGDVDWFDIRFPAVQPLGGRCASGGYSFLFGAPVDARVYLNGALYRTFQNGSFFVLPFELGPAGLVLEVSPAFPGQIVSYALDINFFQRLDGDCLETTPPNKWELLKECPMCDLNILEGPERVILDPSYRRSDLIPVRDHVFYWQGQGRLEVPIGVLQGNGLRAELVDERGKVLATAERAAGAPALMLESPGALDEGVYSLRFSGYGNGTEIEVAAPQR